MRQLAGRAFSATRAASIPGVYHHHHAVPPSGASLRPLGPAYAALSDFFRAGGAHKTLHAHKTRPWQRAPLNGRKHLSARSFITSASRYDAPDKRTPIGADQSDSTASSSSSSHHQKADAAQSQSTSNIHPDHLIRHVSSFPRSLRDLALSLPSATLRRPTKDELLASTSSFFERLRIRFKWFTIRGFRRFRTDDWSAFVSWVLGGVGIWIVVGTTSFFSALFLLANSLQMQEWMAAKLGSYLTSHSGVTVIFESAIVPKFSLRDSRITFKNVYISRGMGSHERGVNREREFISSDGERGVRQTLPPLEEDEHGNAIPHSENRSRSTSSTGHDIDNPRVRRASSDQLADIKSRDTEQDRTRHQHHHSLHHHIKVRKHHEIAANDDSHAGRTGGSGSGEDSLVVQPNALDDIVAKTQKTDFHFTIDSIEVALSLPRWLDGKGLVKDAKVKGVRGVIDRSHLSHSADDALLDYRRFRNKPQPGDFQLESLQIEDFLATVYQPESFRPYTFSIFQANIGNLRKQWLFYDLLSAESITGQVDNCLFSLHKPQSIGRTSEDEMKHNTWKRMSRFRIDGVPIDHLQSARDKGPMSWIMSGRADLVADIRFPRGPEDDVDINTIIGDIVDNLDEALKAGSGGPAGSEVTTPPTTTSSDRIPGRPALTKGRPLEAPSVSLRSMLGIEEDDSRKNQQNRVVCMRLDIRFRDVKAAVPLFPDEFSSVNSALVRPIVAFLNANRTLIPIRCHVDVDLAEFDGSWTTYDIALLDAVAEQVYAALANHVQDSNVKRAKAVGLWSLQKSAATILLALKDNLEHL